MKNKADDRETARAELREMLSKGDVLYTVLRHTSAGGMSRSIDVYKFAYLESDGQVHKHWLSPRVATALELRWDETRDAVRVQGAGMDMGFHLVYSLAMALYGDGYALKQEWL